MDVKRPDLLQKIIDIDWRFNSVASSLDEYKNLNHTLRETLRIVDAEGLQATFEISSDELIKFKPKAAELDDLLRQVYDSCEVDFVDSKAAFDSLAVFYKVYFREVLPIELGAE